MIKANELRIGNWVNYKGEPIPVTMVGQYGIQSKTDERLINAKFSTPDIQPIPLTSEILEKAGFVKLSETAYGGSPIYKAPKGHNAVYNHPNERETFIYGVSDYNNGYYHLTGLKYLHQLQNLYFALTGEELPISL